MYVPVSVSTWFEKNNIQCPLINYQRQIQTSSKYAKLAKCSQDTAIRDLRDLMGYGLLRQGEGGGRSTHYELAEL